MKVGSVIFEDAGYCGVFDDSFELIWCDNAPLYKRLLKHKDGLIECYNRENPIFSNNYIFKYDKRNYCAVLTNIKQEFIMCRVFPEKKNDSFVRELSDELETISCSALSIMDSLEPVFRSAKNSEIENLKMYLKYQQEEAEAIYVECLNISHGLLFESAAEYIPIHKFIIGTLLRIKKMTSRFGRRLVCSICVLRPFVKIDYPMFEKAIYNISKIFFKCGTGDAQVMIIDDSEGKTLKVDFKFKTEYENIKDICQPEMRGVSGIFSALGGESELTVSGKNAQFIGTLPVVGLYSYKKAASLNDHNLNEYMMRFSDEGFKVRRRPQNKDSYLRSPRAEFEVGFNDYGTIIFGSLTDEFDE